MTVVQSLEAGILSATAVLRAPETEDSERGDLENTAARYLAEAESVACVAPARGA